MENRLVTLKTFDNPPEAHLAKNRLEDAGLQVLLQGEDTVGMNWLLSNALGGIQLLVRSEDLVQAQQLLSAAPTTESANRFESDHENGTTPDDPWGSTADEDDEAEPIATDREQNADRAFRGAVMGILFFPLQLYVFWLLLRVFVSDDHLRGRHRARAWWAAAINIPYMLGMCVVLRGI